VHGTHSEKSEKEDKMSSQPALVIGNGESRKSLDLHNLDLQITKIGCNAIHRDLTVDYLVCCDGRMVKESVENPNNQNTKIFTRQRYYQDYRKIKKHKNVFLLPDLPYKSNARIDNPIHWNSGPYALLLASQMSNDIHMIGFDLYGIDHKVNNVYKNTNNYSGSKTPAVDPAYWIYQIAKVISCYPDNRYRIYNVEGWKIPREWTHRNVEHLAVKDFKISFDNQINSSIINAVV
jgi:hypothetical protein